MMEGSNSNVKFSEIKPSHSNPNRKETSLNLLWLKIVHVIKKLCQPLSPFQSLFNLSTEIRKKQANISDVTLD